MSLLNDRREVNKGSGATLADAESVTSGQSLFRRVRVRESETVGLHLQWNDATTNGTFKVYLSGRPDPTEYAATGTVDVSEWDEVTSSLTITGPAASAAGCETVEVGVLGQPWLMVEFDATANSDITIYVNGK